jgi:hypothetical protein
MIKNICVELKSDNRVASVVEFDYCTIEGDFVAVFYNGDNYRIRHSERKLLIELCGGRDYILGKLPPEGPDDLAEAKRERERAQEFAW